MTVPTVACTNCGKNFTTDDLRGTNCRYCGTLLAHHARAQQQVAVVNEMLADRNGNGIPDAYEGLVANAQANAMNQAFGMNQNPYYGMQQQQPMMMMMGQPQQPQVFVNGMPVYGQAGAQIAQQTTKMVGSIMMVVVISIVGITLLTVGIVVFAILMAH